MQIRFIVYAMATYIKIPFATKFDICPKVTPS